MSAFTANTVIIAAIFMGILLFAAVYIGLYFSKKSAKKFREKNGIDTEK
jgi:uncharacterized protein YneF (UPF0154 family)